MRLEEINASIQIKQANLAQLPKVTSEKKAEMTAKYNDFRAIHSQRNNVISRSAAEDNGLITEADTIRLDALNVVRVALNL